MGKSHQSKWRTPQKESEVVIVNQPTKKITKQKYPKPKLTIDFNLIYKQYISALNALDYKDYLLTDHWLRFKREAVKNAMNRCQLCSATDSVLNVHHKTYKTKGFETFNDVIVLCESCHKMVHGR